MEALSDKVIRLGQNALMVVRHQHEHNEDETALIAEERERIDDEYSMSDAEYAELGRLVMQMPRQSYLKRGPRMFSAALSRDAKGHLGESASAALSAMLAEWRRED